MLNHISIRNFQSLRKIDIELGPFTVIVGSSSSGKSGSIRALRALVSNVRGSSYVTRGAKTASVSVDLNDTIVALERGDGVGRYTIKPEFYEAKEYTKLNGSVPEDVTDILRISSDLCFSQQFDSPYLLTESGAVVARALGELTNVSTIFAAAREGNRLRLSTQSILKLRSADLDDLRIKAQEFGSLGINIELCTQAEASLARADALSLKVSRLRELLSHQVLAEQVLARVVVPDVPLSTELVRAYDRLRACRSLVDVAFQAERACAAAEAQVAVRELQLTTLHDMLHDLLVTAGVCPTCGNTIKGA